MHVRIGSSGFSYDFWRGDFYPADLASDDMLAFYAARFDTVEINNTFYRMPKAEVLRRWADVVPANFRFVIKASRRITHMSRLRDTADNVQYLYRQLESLGDKLGAVLYQCPPFLRRDDAVLQAFVAGLPTWHRAAIEFRHRSWFCDEVYAVLRGAAVCLCASDEDQPDPPLVATAPIGYLRLRADDYDDGALGDWLARVGAAWPESYVFFKHEQSAPGLITRGRALLAAVASP